MKTILVTGAGGYIGSTLVETLLNSGNKVIGYDRYFFGEELLGDILKHPNFKLVKKDIRDTEKSDLMGVDAICDLAALSNDPSGDLDDELTESINYIGRVRVARMAKEAGVSQYVLASSCSVYGSGLANKLTEQDNTNPLTTYAKANIKAENDILPFAEDDFMVTALRLSTVYGLSRRMRFDLIVNVMTLNAVETGKIIVFCGGKQWRPLIHVKDAAGAFELVLKSDKSICNKQIFNVGSNEQTFQVINLGYLVREIIPFPIELEVIQDDPDKRSYNVSFDKIKDILGFEPMYQPVDGVKEIYEAIKSGKIGSGVKMVTVQWYKRIMEAEMLIEKISLNNRIL